MADEVEPNGFKRTEIGQIPVDWDTVTCDSVCLAVIDCKNRTPPVLEDGSYAVVRTPNVRNGRFVTDNLVFTDEASYKIWTQRGVPTAGDVLITREAPLGEVCAAPENLNFCLGQRMMLYRPDQNKISSNYLLAALQSEAVQSHLKRVIGGSTVGHARVDDIRFLLIPLPPLPEQEAIAGALTDADGAVGAVERLTRKKRAVKQAALHALLTPTTRLPGFDGEWETKTLGDICFFENGDRGHLYPSKSDFITNGGVPFVNAGHIGDGKIYREKLDYIAEVHRDRLRSGKYKIGDILFCLRGSLGKFGLVTEETANGAIASSLIIIRVSEKLLDRGFLLQYLGSTECARMIELWSGGAAQPNLGGNQLEKFEIFLPPLAEQRAIAAILSDMDAEIAALEARRDKLKAVKQGMMQSLLTGKVRLV